jgi:hypothetical protein
MIVWNDKYIGCYLYEYFLIFMYILFIFLSSNKFLFDSPHKTHKTFTILFYITINSENILYYYGTDINTLKTRKLP